MRNTAANVAGGNSLPKTAVTLLQFLSSGQWRNDGVAAASSDGGPTGGIGGPDSSRVLSD